MIKIKINDAIGHIAIFENIVAKLENEVYITKRINHIIYSRYAGLYPFFA